MGMCQNHDTIYITNNYVQIIKNTNNNYVHLNHTTKIFKNKSFKKYAYRGGAGDRTTGAINGGEHDTGTHK